MGEESNVAEQIYGGLVTAARLFILILLVASILLLGRIILLFFGSLKTVPGYEQILAITDYLIGPLDSIVPIKTPYGGIFDIAAAGVLVTAMLLEYVFQNIRDFFEKQSVRHRAAKPAKATAAASAGPEIESELVKK